MKRKNYRPPKKTDRGRLVRANPWDEPAGQVDPQLTRWILYYQAHLEKKLSETEGETLRILVERPQYRGTQIEEVEVQRVAVEVVLDGLARALRAMHPEHRDIFRARFKRRCTHAELSQRNNIHPARVTRRLREIVDIATAFMGALPKQHMDELRRAVEG